MEKHLIQEIRRRFKGTPAAERVSEIREFMGRSETNRKLIAKAFPELYREAIHSVRPSSAFSSSELTQPVELSAKPH